MFDPWPGQVSADAHWSSVCDITPPTANRSLPPAAHLPHHRLPHHLRRHAERHRGEFAHTTANNTDATWHQVPVTLLSCTRCSWERPAAFTDGSWPPVVTWATSSGRLCGWWSDGCSSTPQCSSSAGVQVWFFTSDLHTEHQQGCTALLKGSESLCPSWI